LGLALAFGFPSLSLLFGDGEITGFDGEPADFQVASVGGSGVLYHSSEHR